MAVTCSMVKSGTPNATKIVVTNVMTAAQNLRLVNLLADKIQEVTAKVTPEGQAVTCNQYRLEIVNADKVINGFMFRCKYSLDSGQPYLTTEPITLTVTDKCSQNGHTGGKATCYQRAICEVCGTAYGEVDPENHTGTAEWDTRYWNIANTHWKTWSCCHKQIDEGVHTFENGVCTVCGCVCDHALKKKANCHEEGKCYICGVKTDDIDPDNHDLSLGTTTRDEKDPTCTEDGYAGDTVCWECLNVISTGEFIPAKGHDTTWEATCHEPAYCIVCREYYGEKKPNNHYEPWSAYYTNVLRQRTKNIGTAVIWSWFFRTGLMKKASARSAITDANIPAVRLTAPNRHTAKSAANRTAISTRITMSIP